MLTDSWLNRWHETAANQLLDLDLSVPITGDFSAAVAYDGVTRLPNQAFFRQAVTDWLAQSTTQSSGALMGVIDIDRFFRYNVSFGFAVGNEILRTIAKRIQERLGRQGLLARLNCDEFGLLLPDVSEEPEKAVLLLMQIFNVPFQHGELDLYLTASVGFVRIPEDATDVEKALIYAGSAVQAVKQRGGNSVLRYTHHMSSQNHQRMSLDSDLHSAQAREQLVLHYQPCVNSVTLEVTSFEALVRWQHPKLGLLMPAAFIPIADETGYIVELGRWILTRACCDLQKTYNRYRVSVNVSPVQFCRFSLLQDVEHALRTSGLAPERLVLEITESSLMQEVELSCEILRRLKEMGVTLSIDDFGTGYSSLSYLRQFPIDELKIDRSFIQGVGTSDKDEDIIRAILSLARCLRLTTVAEGVESGQQATFLRREGCHNLQGFYFSSALAWNEIPHHLTPGGHLIAA